jgi:hypothetical protein
VLRLVPRWSGSPPPGLEGSRRRLGRPGHRSGELVAPPGVRFWAAPEPLLPPTGCMGTLATIAQCYLNPGNAFDHSGARWTVGDGPGRLERRRTTAIAPDHQSSLLNWPSVGSCIHTQLSATPGLRNIPGGVRPQRQGYHQDASSSMSGRLGFGYFEGGRVEARVDHPFSRSRPSSTVLLAPHISSYFMLFQ